MKLPARPFALTSRQWMIVTFVCGVVTTGATLAIATGLTQSGAVDAAAQSAEPKISVPRGTPDTITPEGQRTAAPDFTLTDAKGQTIKLSAYKGKVVLLDFWATWCGGCKVEIPWYMAFDKKYRDHGLAVIGVSMDDDGWKSVRPFLARKIDDETGGNIAMEYPVVIGNEELGKKFKLENMPMTLLIDREGRIAVSHSGMVDKESFESNIRSLLK